MILLENNGIKILDTGISGMFSAPHSFNEYLFCCQAHKQYGLSVMSALSQKFRQIEKTLRRRRYAQLFVYFFQFPVNMDDPRRLGVFLKILQRTDLDDYESLQYFQRVLISSGIIDALRERGINEGDTVSIYDLEFDFVN